LELWRVRVPGAVFRYGVGRGAEEKRELDVEMLK
jgi:hypothetical protein